MLLERELAFESVKYRLDPLAAAGGLAEPGGLVFAVGADQVRAGLTGDEVLEAAAGEALVADDDLPGGGRVVIAGEHAWVTSRSPIPRVGQSPDDGHALGGGDQVEAELQKNRNGWRSGGGTPRPVRAGKRG